MDRIRNTSMNYWQTYGNIIKQNCFDASASTTGMPYWQNQLFARILKYFLPLSIFVIIPGIVMSLTAGLYFLALSEMVAFASIAFVALSRGLSVYTRKTLFIMTIYFAAVVLLGTLGSFGPGLTYLVVAIFFTAMIFSKREGYWSLALNAFICVAFGFALHHAVVDPVGDEYSLASWTTVSANVIIVSVIIYFLLHRLFDKIEESNRRFKMAIQATSETIWEWDLVHNKMYHNEGMQTMFGYTEPEIGEEMDWWNAKIHPDDVDRVVQGFTRFFEEAKGTLQLQYRFRCADGSYKHVCNRAVLAFDKQGRPTSMIGAIQDINDMVTHMNDIEQKNEKLEQIAWVQSHKVRNHVATIIGLSHLIDEQKGMQGDNLKIIEGITESCRNLDGVIKEINDLTEDISHTG